MKQPKADLNISSLAHSDGDGHGTGVGVAPVPPADPDSTRIGDLSPSMSHSGPATQEHGVFRVLSADKDEVHSD